MTGLHLETHTLEKWRKEHFSEGNSVCKGMKVQKGLVQKLPYFCFFSDLLAMDRKAAWLLREGEGNSMEQVAGCGDHFFPRKCQDAQSPCSSAPLPFGACKLSSQPPLFSPNQDEIGPMTLMCFPSC